MSNKTVIVTGGTRGLGRVISERFAALGASVVTIGRHPPEVGISGSVFVAADVRDPEQISTAVEETVSRFSTIDVLVNNAGGAPHALVAETSANFSDKIISLNLLAPLNFSKTVNEIMQTQGSGGTIVNIGSVSGTRSSPGTAAYGAAKAGLSNLTQSLAVEWAPKVRVNCVVAGPILTEQASLHFGDDDGIAAVGNTIGLGRLAFPSDIAEAVLWLASPLASYVSGANLLVHGGGERPIWMAASNAPGID